MQMSITPQQTALERRIIALGPARSQQLSFFLSALAALAFSYSYMGSQALQASPIFAGQTLLTLLILCAGPALLHVSPPQPSLSLVVLLALIFIAVPLPVLLAFLKDLFTGHINKEDAHWFDAIWRIYTVFFCWIGFAIINEAKIRPRLRARAIRLRDEKAVRVAAGEEEAPAANSVAARADAMRRNDRDVKLTGLREKLITARGVRDEAILGLSKKEGDEVRARERVVKAENALKRATGRGDEEEIAEAKELLEGSKEMVGGVKAMSRAQVLVLEDAEERIKELDEQWLHWSNLANYPFYR